MYPTQQFIFLSPSSCKTQHALSPAPMLYGRASFNLHEEGDPHPPPIVITDRVPYMERSHNSGGEAGTN